MLPLKVKLPLSKASRLELSRVIGKVKVAPPKMVKSAFTSLSIPEPGLLQELPEVSRVRLVSVQSPGPEMLSVPA